MSKANKCDRCGTLYEHEIYSNKLFIGRRPYNNEFFDLCPMCQKNLEKWFTYPTRIKEKTE